MSVETVMAMIVETTAATAGNKIDGVPEVVAGRGKSPEINQNTLSEMAGPG